MADVAIGEQAAARAIAPADRAARPTYEPALDGVRALAVGAVVVYHGLGVTSSHLGRGGFLGVDVFFVLSGYLITTLLLRERASTGGIALLSFWGRRARRLLPALLVMLGSAVVYAHLVQDGARRVKSAIVPALFYFENWYSVGKPLSMVSHTWSLAIEEQWYLVWPVVLAIVLAGGRRPSWRLLATVVALTAASVAWTARIYSPLNNPAYLETTTRGQSLLVGAGLAILLALWPRPTSGRADRVIRAGGLAGLAVLVWAFATWRDNGASTFKGGLLLVALASAALILAATQPGDSGLRRLLRWRPLVALGIISYGVYLFDPVVIAVFDGPRTHLEGVPLFVLRIAITFGVAYVSWRWVEQPIRRAPSTRAWPWAVIALGVVLVLIGTATIDVPARAAKRPTLPGPDLTTYLKPYRDLAKSTPSDVSRVLVLGGDRAGALAAAARPYRTSALVGIAATARGCGLTSALTRSADPVHHPNGCTFAPGLLEGVAQTFQPSTVVLTVEQQDLASRFTGGQVTNIGSAAWVQDATAQLDRVRRRLPPSVHELLIVGACPRTTPGQDAAATARGDAVWADYARARSPEVRSVTPPSSVCTNDVPAREWAWIAGLTSRAPA
ncbi:MAG TPA: acyltransferase [Acidimicrobiia bacterium]